MMKAMLKDNKGLFVICITDPKFKVMDKIQDFIFKQKILLEKRKINKKEALKALDLGYTIKIFNDEWCEGEQELSIWKDGLNRLAVIQNGSETDEYLPYEYLTPNVKYFLEGTIYDGEYVPF